MKTKLVTKHDGYSLEWSDYFSEQKSRNAWADALRVDGWRLPTAIEALEAAMSSKLFLKELQKDSGWVWSSSDDAKERALVLGVSGSGIRFDISASDYISDDRPARGVKQINGV